MSLENYESLQNTLSPEKAKRFRDDLIHYRDYYVEKWDIFSETANLFSHIGTIPESVFIN